MSWENCRQRGVQLLWVYQMADQHCCCCWEANGQGSDTDHHPLFRPSAIGRGGKQFAGNRRHRLLQPLLDAALHLRPLAEHAAGGRQRPQSSLPASFPASHIRLNSDV